MTIDTKRLETDAAYWDECEAPEGATHYNFLSHGFYKVSGNDVFCSFNDIDWAFSTCAKSEVEGGRNFIPRPTKPAGMEWDGLSAPELGEIAMTSGGKCQVLGWDAQRDKVAVQWHDGDLSVVSFGALKPIRTPEQRQREELVDLMEAERENYFPKAVTAEQVADAILSRYNLEPKK